MSGFFFFFGLKREKREKIHTKAHFQICSSLFLDLKTCDLGNMVQVISFCHSRQNTQVKINEQQRRPVPHTYYMVQILVLK